MKDTLEAVFEGGLFRPLQRPGIAEGEHVRLTVERVRQAAADDVLALAARVYEGLSPADIQEIEKGIVRTVRDSFS